MLLAGAAAQARDTKKKPRIDELAAVRQAEALLVSYRLPDAVSAETLETLQSGQGLTFQHRIEARWVRGFWLPDRLLARTTLEVRVEYDALTRQYVLTRETTREVREGEVAPEPLVEQQTTADPLELRRWMEEIREVPLEPAAPPEPGPVDVRVRVQLGRHYVLLLFPAAISVSAELRVP